MAYALYYNKQIFADAASPGRHHLGRVWSPTERRSSEGQAGTRCRGLQRLREHPPHLRLAKQHGADFFTADGKADFTNDGVVAAVKQYVDLMAKDKVITVGNAEYAQNQSVSDLPRARRRC